MSAPQPGDQEILEYVAQAIRQDAAAREQLVSAMRRKDTSRVVDVFKAILRGLKVVAPYAVSAVLGWLGITY